MADEPPLLLPKPFAASLAELLAPFLRGAYLRVVNFHNTPRAAVAHYDAQLHFYADHFSAVTEADLAQFFSTGRWHKAKPGLLPAFFEGTCNQLEVALPLLERYGLTVWFFIILQFLEVLPDAQARYSPRYRHHPTRVQRWTPGAVMGRGARFK